MSYLGREAAKAPIVTADLPNDGVTLAKMTGGTDGNIISYDASGDPVAIATGDDGQVLTSTGAGSPPAFETGLTVPAFLVQASAMSDSAVGSDVTLDYDTVIQNVGGGTFASNTYTAPVTGLYQINVSAHYNGFPNNVTDFRLKIVTSNRTYMRLYAKFINAEHASNYDGTFDYSQLVDLDASDTCIIKTYQNSGSAQADLVAANSYFSGFLVSKY